VNRGGLSPGRAVGGVSNRHRLVRRKASACRATNGRPGAQFAESVDSDMLRPYGL